MTVKSNERPLHIWHLVLRDAHYEPLVPHGAELTTLVDTIAPTSVGNADSTRSFYPLEGPAQRAQSCDVGTRVRSTTDDCGVVVAVEGLNFFAQLQNFIRPPNHRDGHRLLVRTYSGEYKTSAHFKVMLLAKVTTWPVECDVKQYSMSSKIPQAILRSMIYSVERADADRIKIDTTLFTCHVPERNVEWHNANTFVESFGFYPNQEYGLPKIGTVIGYFVPHDDLFKRFVVIKRDCSEEQPDGNVVLLDVDQRTQVTVEAHYSLQQINRELGLEPEFVFFLEGQTLRIAEVVAREDIVGSETPWYDVWKFAGKALSFYLPFIDPEDPSPAAIIYVQIFVDGQKSIVRLPKQLVIPGHKIPRSASGPPVSEINRGDVVIFRNRREPVKIKTFLSDEGHDIFILSSDDEHLHPEDITSVVHGGFGGNSYVFFLEDDDLAVKSLHIGKVIAPIDVELLPVTAQMLKTFLADEHQVTAKVTIRRRGGLNHFRMQVAGGSSLDFFDNLLQFEEVNKMDINVERLRASLQSAAQPTVQVHSIRLTNQFYAEISNFESDMIL